MEKINIYLQKVAMKETTKDTIGMYGRGALGGTAGAVLGSAGHAAHPVAGVVGSGVGQIAGVMAGYGSKIKQIAAKHGKTISKGQAFKEGAKTSVREAGRATAEGVGAGGVGAIVGAGVGALTKHPKDGARIGAAIGGGLGFAGGATHGAIKSVNNSVKKYHAKYASEEKTAVMEKLASITGLATKIIGAGKAAGRAIIGDAKKLPGQVKNVGSAFKANGGGVKGATSSGTLSTVKAVVKNKAVLTGAGVVGTSMLANGGMKKQSSTIRQIHGGKKIIQDYVAKKTMVKGMLATGAAAGGAGFAAGRASKKDAK